MASPLIFSANSLAASGGGTDVDIECNGQGPLRVFVKSITSPLSSMGVSIGPDVDHLTALDASVFDSLSADVTKQLLIDAPVGVMRLSPVGNLYDCRVAVALSQGF